MKLYVNTDGEWFGTQADAKADLRDFGYEFKATEVPVDKAGLLDFLNLHRVGKHTPPAVTRDDISDLLGDDEPAVEEILSAKVVTTAPVIDTYTIVDWLLDTATPTQVEVVFGALGARFHEANKDKNND